MIGEHISNTATQRHYGLRPSVISFRPIALIGEFEASLVIPNDEVFSLISQCIELGCDIKMKGAIGDGTKYLPGSIVTTDAIIATFKDNYGRIIVQALDALYVII